LNILFTFRIFEQLALALKNRECPDLIVLNIYFLQWRAVRFMTGRYCLFQSQICECMNWIE